MLALLRLNSHRWNIAGFWRPDQQFSVVSIFQQETNIVSSLEGNCFDISFDCHVHGRSFPQARGSRRRAYGQSLSGPVRMAVIVSAEVALPSLHHIQVCCAGWLLEHLSSSQSRSCGELAFNLQVGSCYEFVLVQV